MLNILQVRKVKLFNIIRDRNNALVSQKMCWWILIFMTAKFFLSILFSLQFFSIIHNYSFLWNTCFLIFPFLPLHPCPWNHCSLMCPLYLGFSTCSVAMATIPFHGPASFCPETSLLRTRAGSDSHLTWRSWDSGGGRTLDLGLCDLQVPYLFCDYICLSSIR